MTTVTSFLSFGFNICHLVGDFDVAECWVGDEQVEGWSGGLCQQIPDVCLVNVPSAGTFQLEAALRPV